MTDLSEIFLDNKIEGAIDRYEARMKMLNPEERETLDMAYDKCDAAYHPFWIGDFVLTPSGRGEVLKVGGDINGHYYEVELAGCDKPVRLYEFVLLPLNQTIREPGFPCGTGSIINPHYRRWD